MKCAKLVDIGKIEIVEIEEPQITDPTDVLVKVKAVGICGTDLHIFKEGRADVQFPRIMGHELSGEVIGVGPAVTKVAVGDKVALDPVFACGECPTCKKGHPNVCSNVKCYGVQMDGGYQEKIVVTEDHLYKFGSGVSYEDAALAEPFSIASNILHRAGLESGENVLIIGAGTIGLSILQVAKMKGAVVMVSDVIPQKLSLAEELGADVVVDNRGKDLEASVKEHFPFGFDVVIDAVGITPLFAESLNYAAPCARVMCIGFDGRQAEFPPAMITRKELSIIGSRMNNRRFPEVMEWFNQDLLNTGSMITKRKKIDEIQEAFEETLSDSAGSVKTLILFD